MKITIMTEPTLVSMDSFTVYHGVRKKRDDLIERGWYFALSLFVMIMFVACGDGGDTGKNIQSPDADIPVNTPETDAVNIEVSPVDQAVIQGQTAVFQVAASGSQPLTYQWMRDGNDIPGETASSYETSSLTAEDDGAAFVVRVSNTHGSVLSSEGTVTVFSTMSIPDCLDYTVDPSIIDSTISPASGENYAAFNMSVSSKNKLFVFFPGTGAIPNFYRLIVRAAANNGYHAIGLAYPNDETAYDMCSDSGDLTACTNQVRQEKLTGMGGPEGYDIPVADSIEYRLQTFLLYLSIQDQGQGWGQFLGDDNGIRWASIRLAGHSQGGSQAGYIGKQYAVDRVIFFASPFDYNGLSSETELWISVNGPTESLGFYGFANVQDNIIPWSMVRPSWISLHMDDFGAEVDVDNTIPPYMNSHMLTTSVEGRGLLPYHNVTVLDYSTPIDDKGVPSFLPVWQYLCFL